MELFAIECYKSQGQDSDSGVESFEWEVMSHPAYGDAFPSFVFKSEALAVEHLTMTLLDEKVVIQEKLRISCYAKRNNWENRDKFKAFGQTTLEEQREWARKNLEWHKAQNKAADRG